MSSFKKHIDYFIYNVEGEAQKLDAIFSSWNDSKGQEIRKETDSIIFKLINISKEADALERDIKEIQQAFINLDSKYQK